MDNFGNQFPIIFVIAHNLEPFRTLYVSDLDFLQLNAA